MGCRVPSLTVFCGKIILEQAGKPLNIEERTLPNYTYICQNCGRAKEEYRPITQRNRIQICSQYGATMQKLVGIGSSFNLRGAGWYKGGWNK